ncbi:hypothetical protein KKHLCK_16700 [Candidatus Electrothrix laxa]
MNLPDSSKVEPEYRSHKIFFLGASGQDIDQRAASKLATLFGFYMIYCH